MICLALDTAGTAGSVALAEYTGPGDARLVWRRTRTLPHREVSRQLIPAIYELLDEAQKTVADIGGFAAVTGPGSFTGLRVGLAAVKGMAAARATPVFSISRLALMAAIGRDATAAGGAIPPAYSVLDAGRGELYVGMFHAGSLLAEQESVASLSAFGQQWHAAPAAVFACEPEVVNRLSAVCPQPPVILPPPSAADLLSLVPLAARGNYGLQFGSSAMLDANYVLHAYPLKRIPAHPAP